MGGKKRGRKAGGTNKPKAVKDATVISTDVVEGKEEEDDSSGGGDNSAQKRQRRDMVTGADVDVDVANVTATVTGDMLLPPNCSETTQTYIKRENNSSTTCTTEGEETQMQIKEEKDECAVKKK